MSSASSAVSSAGFSQAASQRPAGADRLLVYAHGREAKGTTLPPGYVYWDAATQTLGYFHFGEDGGDHHECVVEPAERCTLVKVKIPTMLDVKWANSFKSKAFAVHFAEDTTAQIGYLSNRLPLVRVERPLAVGRQQSLVFQLLRIVVAYATSADALVPRTPPPKRKVRVTANANQSLFDRNRRHRIPAAERLAQQDVKHRERLADIRAAEMAAKVAAPDFDAELEAAVEAGEVEDEAHVPASEAPAIAVEQVA
ncbi:hypothetical protein M3Y99_01427200 [Aphelenchoides fujianensis]|nr:hypothetical protein M3Y99_01427200 [Aphelenchoides fujianensis]